MILSSSIVFSREEEKQFLLCHIPLIEIEIIKLEAQILKATLSRSRFLHLLFEVSLLQRMWKYIHFSYLKNCALKSFILLSFVKMI